MRLAQGKASLKAQADIKARAKKFMKGHYHG
jgi:hypothetical protein